MKITQDRLRQIIKEELGAVLSENSGGKTLYIVGESDLAYGAEDAIRIAGIYDSKEAAYEAIAELDRKRAADGHGPMRYEVFDEYTLNTPLYYPSKEDYKNIFTEETDEEFNAAVEKAMKRFDWSREHAETVLRGSREREKRDKARGGYKGGDRDERTTPRRYTRNY
jgi:hypothetical protein